ncbi:MAG: cysS [Candidatus Saccharibacteria bacterium]|nr:cysS [Candidatus Saccharibacteria bacterium]
MKLYNTLTRQADDIVPLHPDKVTVYTCGPTVYDYPHIGNWFTYIREDILIRVLKVAGLHPDWVMNITDVGHLVSDADEGEDKLEKGARREGKTAWEVAAHYTDYFLEGLDRLSIIRPDHVTKATEHIEEQIALIKTLEDKGFTYVINDGVYYDTSKFPAYAVFARLDLDEQQAGARVEYNTEKRQPTDFALWKFSPDDRQRDMEWDSPWGKGFPGWHIECSAMSMKYLGPTIDIHAGGIDHVPVHHTNEIAQSEAATGQRFAQYWMHSNHIMIEGDKISKSLGNGYTLEDIEAHDIELQAFRLHVLESHYRSQSKFSWDSLQAAQNRLRNWRATAVLRWQPKDMSSVSTQLTDEFARHLLNDLNTPLALAKIDEDFAKLQASLTDNTAADGLTGYLQLIKDSLGIDLLGSTPDITDDQKRLISERDTARADRDWRHSDEIREALAEQGIAVRDTAYGTIWARQ